MSKHKKTRQEKVISQLRRKLQVTSADSQPDTSVTSSNQSRTKTFSFHSSTHQTRSTPTPYITTTPSLLHDLSKTAILTTTLISIQLAIFLLMKSHIITIPGLHY